MENVIKTLSDMGIINILFTIAVGAVILKRVIMNIITFMNSPTDEQIDQIKKVLEEIIVSYVQAQEEEFLGYNGMGEIKRANVISMIYDKFPILKKYTDQEMIIDLIDEMIDDALIDVRDLVESMIEQDKECSNGEGSVKITSKVTVED